MLTPTQQLSLSGQSYANAIRWTQNVVAGVVANDIYVSLQRMGGSPLVAIGPPIPFLKQADIDSTPALTSAVASFGPQLNAAIAAKGKTPTGLWIRRLYVDPYVTAAGALGMKFGLWTRTYTLDAGNVATFGTEQCAMYFQDIFAAAKAGKDAVAVSLAGMAGGIDTVFQPIATSKSI